MQQNNLKNNKVRVVP